MIYNGINGQRCFVLPDGIIAPLGDKWTLLTSQNLTPCIYMHAAKSTLYQMPVKKSEMVDSAARKAI